MAEMNPAPLSIWGVGPRLAFWGVGALSICLLGAAAFGIPVVLAVTDVGRWAGIVWGAIGMYFWIASAIMVVRDVPNGKLMTGGVFACCRNPMYAAFILFLLPSAMLLTGIWALLSASMVMALVFPALIRKEEDSLKLLFGEAYLDYCRRIPRLLPLGPLMCRKK